MTATTRVAAVLTVLGEPSERLRRRFQELGAQVPTLTEVVVAAPVREHPALRAAAPADMPYRLRLVDNPGGQRSAGLNRATMATDAEVIVRVDARSSIGPEHAARAVQLLADRPKVGIVGGPQLPVPGDASLVGRAIARVLANPWALGGAAYRRRGAAGPTDTVYLGAFRSFELRSIGGYDERLPANEDFELCQRYRASGKVVWLEPALAMNYEARTTVGALARQYLAFGRSKATYWRMPSGAVKPRQALGLGLPVLGVMVGLWAMRSPRRLGFLAGAGVAILGVLDDRGSSSAASPALRGVALPLYPLIWGSWLLGVLLGRRQGCDGSGPP